MHRPRTTTRRRRREDLALVRSICANLRSIPDAAPAGPRGDDPSSPCSFCTWPPSDTDEEEDDLETLRAIQSRFSHYQSRNESSGFESLARTFVISGAVVTADVLLKPFMLSNGISLFGCFLVASGAGFGLWLYNLTTVCYHSLYLPLLYVTFLADFFQEEDMLLENVYYSEMKDAGFFDADWD